MPAVAVPPPSLAVVSRLKQRYGDADLVIEPLPAAKKVAAPTVAAQTVAAPIKAAALAPVPAKAPPVAPPTLAPPKPVAAEPPKPLAVEPLPEPPPPPPMERTVSGRHVVLQLVGNQTAPSTVPDAKSEAFKAAVKTVDDTLKAFQPLVLTTLPVPIQQTLAWMRKQADDAVRSNPKLKPSAEMGHDLRLLRFLIGEKFEPQKALDAYVKMLDKRRELKLDELRDAIVGANPGFFGGGSMSLDKVFFAPKAADVEKAMPRLYVDRSKNPSGPYPLLMHRHGHLLEIDQAPDLAKISSVGANEWTASMSAFTEMQTLLIDELSRRDGVLRMVCKITDVVGRESALAGSMMPNPFASGGERAFKQNGELMKALYPTVTYKWYMINLRPNFQKTVQKAIGTFGGRSKHKMIVLDTEFAATVFLDVDPAMMPTSLGGKLQMAW